MDKAKIVVDIVAKTVLADTDKLDLNADLINQYGLDSLHIVELTMKVEEELQIIVPDDVMEKFRTTQQIIDYVHTHH